jgi:hypothetical protein
VGTIRRAATAIPASAVDLDLDLDLLPRWSRHHKSRLGCRLNAGGAQWAERHGCRESRPPPWMADGGGPTERRRSEGTSTKSRPNREPEPLVTWGYQVTRRRRNASAVRQNQTSATYVSDTHRKPSEKNAVKKNAPNQSGRFHVASTWSLKPTAQRSFYLGNAGGLTPAMSSITRTTWQL